MQGHTQYFSLQSSYPEIQIKRNPLLQRNHQQNKIDFT